ncbi:hypothetical protein NDU88_005307 [Pleurodeles waltl]|uniref:Uncharacterized protein n=1 Tax=Pleurodeles waltl TaxID=8319 RepID=A0AAV7WXX0_PLEWA|nr:hypothetical protein NDU88_005307 [Pleurodeles waltl]
MDKVAGMSESTQSEAVRTALRTLSAASRVDLRRPGVLEETWVGMCGPLYAALRGVAVAIATCSPSRVTNKWGGAGRDRGSCLRRLSRDQQRGGSRDSPHLPNRLHRTAPNL